ncbi:alpha-2-macroglobulin [Candidatus Omnitrophota bacterium]
MSLKNIWKFVISVLFLVFFFNGISSASDIKKADDLFEKGTFQEALKEYEEVFKEATDPEIRQKAFFRICESLAHLFRYGEAADKLISTPVPAVMPDHARVLILKAEILRNFLMQYSSFQRGDVIDEEEGTDVFRLTPEEIKDHIRKAYKQLWELRGKLVQMELKKEKYFLEVKDVDFGRFPTMFDYLIFSWTNFLLGVEANNLAEGEVKPRADLLLKEKFQLPVDLGDSPALIAAELMEEAGRVISKNRLEAAERWRIQRIGLALKRQNLFDLRDLAEDKTLFDYKDVQQCQERSKKILLKWMDKFKTDEARGEAGYEAALILNATSKLAEAVELCERIEKNFPGTHSSRHARILRSRIEMPTLNLQTKTTLPPAKEALTLTTKNLEKAYFRVYLVDTQQLKDEFISFRRQEYGNSYNSFEGWSRIFNLNWHYQDWGKKWLKSYLSGKTPYKAWDIETGDKGDYAPIAKTESPPKLEPGIYLILACGDRSFKIGSSLLATCFLNVTDFVLIGTAGFTTKTQDAYYDYIETRDKDIFNDEGFHLYTINVETGKPVEGADINAYTYLSRQSKREFFDLKTNSKGRVSLSLPVNVSPHHSNGYSLDPLAKSKGSFSYWNNAQHLNYTSPDPVEVFIETDRPIYRPADKVQAKAVVVWRTPEGFRTLRSENPNPVTFSASDPNYKEFFTEKVELSEFGSASVSFQIPQGRLLGSYTLSAQCGDGRFSRSRGINFSVEEYKRPEFEITLKPAAEAWKYNEPVEIKGEAKYYFGGPVPEAAVKYRVKRQVYIPWCFRYWFGQNYYSNAQEIATGDLKTDAEGNFTIPFTPTSPAQQYGGNIPDIAQFIIEVEGRDSGGRTIETQESYKAGKSAIYFVIEPKKGFDLEEKAIEIDSKRLTINDTAAPGPGSYEVYTLADTPPKSLKELGYGYGGYWRWIPPLDVQLKDVENGKFVAKGEVEHDKEGKGTIKLPPLRQGAYRIIMKSQDKWGEEVEQKKIFVVAKNTKEAVPVKAASVTLVENDEYKVGDVARLVIGSGLGSGVYHIELWAGVYLLSHQLIDGDSQVRLIEIPVTEKMKGGFTLRWFGVKEFDVNYGQAVISVPWKEKKLKLSLDPFNKELKPGEEVSWGVKLNDVKGKPVRSEVLALMYDRSLEYYMTSNNLWLDNLYALRTTPVYWSYPVLEQHARNLRITEGLLEKLLKAFRDPSKEPNLPGLRTWRTWTEGDYYSRGTAVGGRFGNEATGRMLALPSTRLKDASDQIGDQFAPWEGLGLISKEKKEHEVAAEKVEARKAFADTAFFKPHIVTLKDGIGAFSFTAPEQLTSWRIKLFAFTKDVKEGTLIEEAVTKKDLMVRADLPRFFREKDKGTVTAIVHNESDKPLEGELFIEITEDGKKINEKLKLKDNRKVFKVGPHSLATYNWMIEIPEGISTYKVRVVAVAGELSDAEERELPILPSRQRLIESALITLSGSQTKDLKITLKDDPTRINESMVLQIDPQLALSILNTMPFLVEYPHQCVEQILNKYVPLSIINEVYKKYPAIQRAVSKIPDRKTPTPPWEKNDPSRLIELMETPWVWQSEGRPTPWPIIDLLDPKIVAEQKEINFNKLKSAQLANGAFPWWPGGKPDPYMTLYVLAGLAEARRYEVDVPKDMIQKALRYVNKKIPLLLKAEERELSIVSFAAYVVTSFSPKEYPEAKKGHKAAKSWVVFLEKHIRAMTPLGKAYLSFTYMRLGDKKKAEELLDMAMDGAREDPIAGVYWTPEKYSWVWYSDSVEKHAFFLRTLQELRPDDERIDGMVQWLLFSRKGTVWKSTKASVAAVYALLDYLNQRGALASDETFKVKWGEKTYSEVVKADDWLDEPIRWQEAGFEITPQMSKAVIEKEGPGLAFASMTWTYSTDQIPEASTPGMLELKRKFYRRVKEGDDYHLKPIKSGEEISVGDQIEVQLKINTRSQFEYMHLKDLKAAGFEAETLLSGWKYDPLSFYEEPRDSLTNFFISWLPHGEYILRYRLRPTKPGVYRVGAATLQSMYAPDMTAHSSGFIIKVVEE